MAAGEVKDNLTLIGLRFENDPSGSAFEFRPHLPVILTVVSVRHGSTRLPGKALEKIDGRPMLRCVIERARQIGYPVVVACPYEDVPLFTDREWQTIGGPRDDVLLRLLDTVDHFYADHLVRVTADCPLLDPEAARFTVMCHLETGADFTHHIAEGRAVEVFTREALSRSERESRGRRWTYREHPDEWILQHPENFNIHQVKFSVDTQQDLERVRRFHTWPTTTPTAKPASQQTSRP